MANETKLLLEDSAKHLSKKFGINYFTDYARIFLEDTAFNAYVNDLAEGLEKYPEIKNEFIEFSQKIREELVLEFSTYNFSPQAQLVLPIFRVYWPKLIAREAVTVVPMSRNEEVRYFFRPKAYTWDGSEYDLPTFDAISSGTPIGSIDTPYMVNNMAQTDLLSVVHLTADQASIERTLLIVSWDGTDASGAPVGENNLTIRPDDDGRFVLTVTVDETTGLTDTVQGYVDFANGTITVTSLRGAAATGKVNRLGIVASVAQESNLVNTKIDMSSWIKVQLITKEKKLSTNWSTELEKDVKAYFDFDIQSAMINIAADQIATEIDREIINDLIITATNLHPAAVKTFDYNPPATSTFALSPKAWMDSIILPLNEVSSQIYSDTFFGTANVILSNPADTMIFETLDNFRLNGDMVDGGVIGRSPAVTGTFKNRWIVLSSPVVPKGKMVLLHKPDVVEKAIYIYGVYQPLVLTPYPIANTPSLTMYTRYAKTVVRPEGVGLVEVNR